MESAICIYVLATFAICLGQKIQSGGNLIQSIP